MGHLIKKLNNTIHDNFSYDINIERQNMCGFNIYIIRNRSSKKFIYYNYDKSLNFKTNKEIIFALIKYKFNYCEIENCKECKKFMLHSEYQKCKRNCFYFMFCRKKEIL